MEAKKEKKKKEKKKKKRTPQTKIQYLLIMVT